MGQTIAEAIWEEGWLKGLAEGELWVARQMLRRLLAARFASLPEEVVQRMEACTDLERLMTAAEQVQSLDKLEDLRL